MVGVGYFEGKLFQSCLRMVELRIGNTTDEKGNYLRRTVRICAVFSWTNSSCASSVLHGNQKCSGIKSIGMCTSAEEHKAVQGHFPPLA